MLGRRQFVGSLGALGLAPALALAENGVSDREILIGRSTPASSPPFKDMALQRRTAADACIAALNAAGGVHGRRLRIVDRDDAYQAPKAEAVVRELIEKERVFAMLGAFGSPTLPAIIERVEAAGVPLIGAVTLGREAREPPKRFVFPVRISSQDETAHVVEHQRTIGMERFAVLASKEGFGPEGAYEFRQALAAARLKPVADIDFSLKDDGAALARRLIDGSPQAILAATLPQALANVLKPYRAAGGGAQVLGFSAMRIEDLSTALGPLAVGVGLSQAFPPPTRRSVPLVKRFNTVLAAHAGQAEPSYHGLDAYVEATVLIEGLRRAGRDLTRAALVNALESMHDFDTGGVVVRYGRGNRTGSTYVDIVMLGREGRLVY